MTPNRPTGAEPDRQQPQADIEALAAIEHEQWIEWASTLLVHEPGISEERRQRWQRLIATPYADLTEAEKHQDRVYAEKVARVAQPQAGALAAALERLVAVCMTEEEDRLLRDLIDAIYGGAEKPEGLSDRLVEIAGVLDKVDSITDDYLESKGSDHRVGREFQADLRTAAAILAAGEAPTRRHLLYDCGGKGHGPDVSEVPFCPRLHADLLRGRGPGGER